MHEGQSNFFGPVVAHLQSRGWSFGQCYRCELSFFACPPRETCGRPQCLTPLGEDINPRGRPRFPDQIWEVVRSHFSAANFITTNRRDIANPSHRSTRFVGAGLQVFEDGLERGAVPPAMPLFVPQPVIRLNYWDSTGAHTINSTSFANLCTEHARSSMTEFLRHLDLWLVLLVDLRIRMQDTSIILGAERWHGGPFAGPSLSVEVNGNEIGDAILIDEGSREAATYLPIADFSFGLERITAAANPGLEYSLFLGPLPESAAPENQLTIDRVRTATLMCMSGVTPSSRGHGRHLRQSMSDAVTQHSTVDFSAAITHAYRYWSSFITPLRPLQECLWLLESERARVRALEVIRMCGGDSHASAASADEACRRLIAVEGRVKTIIECESALSGRVRADSAQGRRK